LFSYATLYWSAHLPEKKVVDAEESSTLTNALRQFCCSEALVTWIRSVLAYSDQSIYLFDDIHLHSVVPTVLNALVWLQQRSSQSRSSQIFTDDGSRVPL